MPSDGKEIRMAQKAIVGRKVGMTQVWDDDNKIVPVTVLEVAPCRVVQVKTNQTDGYAAIQVTLGSKEAKKLSKPEAGHFASAGVAPGDELVELRLDDVSDYTVGQEIAADVFAAGEQVDAIGTSKGKGFTGVMKRHNFSGQRATHGAHLVHRMPGSSRAVRYPSTGLQGHEDGRAHRVHPSDHAESDRRTGRHRQERDAREGLGSRAQGRHGRDPQRHQEGRQLR